MTAKQKTGFIRRSIEGIRADGERMRQIEPDKVRFSDIVGIFLRGWPYIRPMIWHVVGYLSLTVFVTAWNIFWGITILTLIYNNVILDDPVAPISASILFLDHAVWVGVEEPYGRSAIRSRALDRHARSSLRNDRRNDCQRW